ncbi:roadblock/LC7 domain-containing protein [Methanobacterium petrolearium]|uniref:roadblock/LC7 domain-containing protein n=1 Tax=Methanobacterium petrolearium TaxID=710190 RepID=UPI001AEA2704|nr:roadblock/LC7 domain-containing protein [Methanobacterium petrolearium]MBP1944681.1 putative regulator of Ras-like GTPase activity (Roadblock/LC7/MglB family) [Methanobacterium petrolearium]BDZ69947.1 hypothetical protein GCM10025861_04640 [Methanobacterium petrolearium]
MVEVKMAETNNNTKNDLKFKNENIKIYNTNKNYERILKSINRVKGVKELLLIDQEGRPLAQYDEGKSELGRIPLAALAALQEMMQTISYGVLEQLIVETDIGKILIGKLNEKFALVIITDKNTNIGMIRELLKKDQNFLRFKSNF